MRCTSDYQAGDESNPQSPHFDGDEYSQDEADSDAADELERTPEMFLCMLEMHIDPKADLPPVDLHTWRVDHFSDASVLDVRGLVALLIGGHHEEALMARHMLRERLMDESTEWVEERAAKLMADRGLE